MIQTVAHVSHSKQQEVMIDDLINSYNNNPQLYRLSDTRNLYIVTKTIIDNIDVFLNSSFWEEQCPNTLYPLEKSILITIINKLPERLETFLLNNIFRKKIYMIIDCEYNAVFNIMINATDKILLRFIKYMKIESPYFRKFVNRFIKEYSIIRRGYSPIYEVVYYHINNWIMPYSDRVREKVRKDNWRRIWWLFIILRIRIKEFIWRYYVPPHGKGYLKALHSWNAKLLKI